MFLKKRKPRQQVFKLYLDNTFEDTKIPYDRNLLLDGKKKPMFEPASVFSERRKKGSLYRARKLVFLVDGAFKALTFKKGDTGLNPFWTMEESEDFADKTIAQKLAEYKPMKWSQFIILLIPLAFILVLQLRAMMLRGGF